MATKTKAPAKAVATGTPGQYSVNGKIVNAHSAGAAERAVAANPSKYSSTPPAAKAPPAPPGTPTNNENPPDPKLGNVNTSNANSAIGTQMGANNVANQYNQDVSNADQVGPGGSTTYTYDKDGHIVENQQYTGENKDIFQGGQDLSKAGLSQANNLVSQGYTQPTQNGSDVGLQNVTNAVYQKMRFGQDALDSQAIEQQKQDLANRGIPIGSAAYSNAMNNLQNQQTINKQNAMDSAVQQGTQAMATQAGVQQGYLTGQEGEVSNLQGLGTGVVNQQVNPYNAVTYGAGQQNVMGVAPAYTGATAETTNAAANMKQAGVAAGGLSLANSIISNPNLNGSGSNTFSTNPPQ